ncbi:wax ester/triacylglycerol synthase family O-acyltransferase, partial [Deinococcus detaillensis]
MRLPFGWGRPLWVDDPSFSLADHVSVVECPVPGGRQA